MKLNLAQSLLCGGVCVLGYLGWSSTASSSGEIIAPAAAAQKLSRATVEPNLKLELEIDPFRMSTPGIQTFAAGATREFCGPPDPVEVVVAAVEISTVPSALLETATSSEGSAKVAGESSAATSTASSSPSLAAHAAASAPLGPQPHDPSKLDAVLVAGTIGFAIIDGHVRVRGQNWSTPAGNARLVVLAADHVAIDVAGRVVQLSMQRTDSESPKKPSDARSKTPKRVARRST